MSEKPKTVAGLLAEAFVRAFEEDPKVRAKFFNGMKDAVERDEIKDPYRSVNRVKS